MQGKREECDENKESGEDKEKLISEIPHILLEESDGAEYDSEYRCLYYINNVHLKLKEDGKEFEPLIKAFDKYNVDELFEGIMYSSKRVMMWKGVLNEK